MSTPQERQDVAGRLRRGAKNAPSESEPRYMWRSVCGKVMYRTDARESELLGYLADLVDPTTTVTEGNEGEELYPVNVATCSACGGTFWAADIFEYCPRCGARITEWQEDECERS